MTRPSCSSISSGGGGESSRTSTPSTTMEGGDENETPPWRLCVMGCTAEEGEEVIVLSCLHCICSNACAKKFMSEVKKGVPLACKLCNTYITNNDDLKIKVNPDLVFSTEKEDDIGNVELICENCVFDRPASNYCPECPACLCTECVKLHPQTRSTQKHVLNPALLKEQEDKQWEALKAKLNLCKIHKGEDLTSVCSTCNVRICAKCVTDHEGHYVMNVQENEDKMNEFFEVAKDCEVQCKKVISNVETKCKDMLENDFKTVMTQVDKNFKLAMVSLFRRHKEATKDVKFAFSKQMNELQRRKRIILKCKANARAVKNIKDKQWDTLGDIGRVNIVKHIQGNLKWVAEFSKRLNQDADKFADKDMGFQVDTSKNFSIQKGLQEFSQIEYCYQPRVRMFLKTYGGKKSSTSAQVNMKGARTDETADSTVVPNQVQNTSGGSEDKKITEAPSIAENIGSGILGLPSPSSPLFVNLAKTWAKGPSSSATSSKPSKETSGDVSIDDYVHDPTVVVVANGVNGIHQTSSTEEDITEQEPLSTTNRRRLRSTSSAPPEDDTMEDSKVGAEAAQKTETNADTIVRKYRPGPKRKREHLNNGVISSASNSNPDISATEGSTVNNIQTDQPHQDNPSGRGREASDKRLLSSMDDKDRNEDRHSDTDTTEVIESAFDDSQIRNNEASVQSPEDSSERGIGKRERKKKSFPGFVDTDICVARHLRIQQSSETEEATSNIPSPAPRTRRRSCSQVHPSKMPKLDTDDSTATDEEVANVNGYASDGGVSESSTSSRRRSLRAKNTNEPIEERSKSNVGAPSPSPSVSSVVSRRGKTPTQNSRCKSAVPFASPTVTRGRRGRPPRRSEDTAATASVPVETFDETDDPTAKYLEAPASSLEVPPELCDYPVQGQGIMKIRDDDNDDSEDYCCICLDGGEEIIVCCDVCPKVFHLSCHMPPIKVIPDEDETWRCNYDASKESIEEEISNFEEVENSESCPLVEESNKRQYLLACKFLMECYKIPEIPTMRWQFPTGYSEKFKKVPYHLKYIKDRLCFSNPSPFASIEEMLLALKQMFEQAFYYYDEEKQDEVRMHAGNGFKKFIEIVEKYYPDYKHLYADKIH